MSLFKKEISVDEKTGKTKITVTANSKKCDMFPLTGNIAKRYVGLSLILADLHDALWWLRQAFAFLPQKNISEDQNVIHLKYKQTTGDLSRNLRAYYYASIITYGKCFSDSAEGRGTKLEVKDHVDDEFKQCHERIIGYRNGLVAHAGNTFDSGEVIVALNPNGPQFHTCANLWRLDFEDDRELQINFEKLIIHVKDTTQKLVDKVLNNLLNDDAKIAAIEYKQKNNK